MFHTTLLTPLRDDALPILIIDKKGFIGERIVSKLKDETIIVFVSERLENKQENVIHLLYKKKLPTIPDNTYSQVLIIDENFQIKKNNLVKIIKKSLRSNTPIFYAVGKKYFNEDLYSQTVVKYKNLRIGSLGDIFAENYIYDYQHQINKIISSVNSENKIFIPNDGNELIYPVLLSDVVDSIIRICFSDFKERVYFIGPKFPISILSAATIFKRLSPETKIDFYKSKTNRKEPPVSIKGNFILGDKYDYVEKIKQINFDKLKNDKKVQHQEIKKSHAPFLYTALFFIILLTLPPLSFVANYYIGGKLSNHSLSYIETGDFYNAKIMSGTAMSLLYISNISFEISMLEIQSLGFNNFAKSVKEKSQFLYDQADFINNLATFNEKLNILLKGKSEKPDQDLNTAIFSVNISERLFSLYKNLSNNDNNLEKLNNFYSFITKTETFWTKMLGIKRERKYLVIVNSSSPSINQESRLIQFNKGKFINLNKVNLEKDYLVGGYTLLIKKYKLDGIVVLKKPTLEQLLRYSDSGDISLNSIVFISDEFNKGNIQIQLKDPLENVAFNLR